MEESPLTVNSRVSVVWLKRDLRLTDHAPLAAAVRSGFPVLLLYVFEPMLQDDEHYDERHWRFVWQSLEDMNGQLADFDATVTIVYGECGDIFSRLASCVDIDAIYSHEEVGLASTFIRDRQIQQWCKQKGIAWYEYQHGAVQRGATDRKVWDKAWDTYMRAPLETPRLEGTQFCAVPEQCLPHYTAPESWQIKRKGMQTGGATLAWKTLDSFYEGRGKDYAFCISKPAQSRNHCSRLSPYLAWGNISVREVYQALLFNWSRPGWRRALSAFSSRLHWHCHFIQKFESECEMEFRHVNAGYRDFPYRNDDKVAEHLKAWKEGRTGFPLVDACMRCLQATGYINFRMRAMLVSFLCHHLNIDWRLGVKHLAALFLDFEPGIHYPQFQMQAGVTGTNTIRIYNPTKQAQEHDPEGAFICRWLPELRGVPVPLLFEPWKLTPMEQQLYGITVAADGEYPLPVVELEQAAREARERLWGWRKRAEVKKENSRILARHVRPE